MHTHAHTHTHTHVLLGTHLNCHTSLTHPHRHEAERLEQKAKGALERQKITDEAEAEKARKDLLELQANRCTMTFTHNVYQQK